MKQIRVTATHPRSGLTRYVGKTYDVADTNGDETITEFDAHCAVAEGQAEWVAPKEKPRGK